jgi:hypothetical protein
MNSNAASILSLARSTASVFTSQGKLVCRPAKGIAAGTAERVPVGTGKAQMFFHGFAATTWSASYQRKASGLSLSRPSYFTWFIPLKKKNVLSTRNALHLCILNLVTPKI